MPQLQHNMWVIAARGAVLSIITGGGKWVEIKVHADPLYQHLIVTAERKFWRCVENGETPSLFGVAPPKPRIEAVRIVDMGSSNAWAEFAAVFTRTRDAHLEHERAKAELKSLVPDDAQQAIGQRASNAAAKGSLQRPGKAVLGSQASEQLCDQLLAQLHDLNNADEAALWAHRSLAKKNQLIAADAQTLEEPFGPKSKRSPRLPAMRYLEATASSSQ
jgi:hypothetical protein